MVVVGLPKVIATTTSPGPIILFPIRPPLETWLGAGTLVSELGTLTTMPRGGATSGVLASGILARVVVVFAASGSKLAENSCNRTRGVPLYILTKKSNGSLPLKRAS